MSLHVFLFFADEFKTSSQYAMKHRSQQQQKTSQEESSNATPPPFAKTLSSPDMIKSVTRTLTPPVSPYHRDQLRFSDATALASRVSPPSSTASSSTSHNVPISDPLIDINWPGRPKRNSFGEWSPEKRRQVSPPIKNNITTSSPSSPSITTSPGTSSKPPIFPSPKLPTSSNDDMPPFMKEFVMRRQSSMENTNNNNNNNNQQGAATPTPTKRKSVQGSPSSISPMRPQSAFIPRPSARSVLNSENKSSQDQRRRSDFISRYESLMNRAQAATKAVDELDILRQNEAKGADVEDDEEDVESVDFNEDEVLQRCQDFLKDYDKSKQQIKSLPQPPVPKPRNMIIGNTLEDQVDPPRPSLRTRSSSLTIHDKNNDHQNSDKYTAKKLNSEVESSTISSQVLPKPILKKSSDDLTTRLVSSEPANRPILKRKDSESSLNNPSMAASNAYSSSSVPHTSIFGGILKRKSMTDEAPPRQDHVRIRSPSPPDRDEPGPISILMRSRNSSFGEEEFPQSILKRRSSQEDLIMDGDVSASAGTSGATSRSSPEPPVHGILKRKLSLGNYSPDQGNIVAGAISSILKKGGTSTTHSSGQGSLEDLTSGSSIAAPMDGIRSILKKRQTGSTDDELDQEDPSASSQVVVPRSILKSRRSEESLSPLSDDCNAGGSDDIKPILKQRDSSRDDGYHSSKLRDKSRSPTRGITSTPEYVKLKTNCQIAIRLGHTRVRFFSFGFSKKTIETRLPARAL
jgi:hypothetical protein